MTCPAIQTLIIDPPILLVDGQRAFLSFKDTKFYSVTVSRIRINDYEQGRSSIIIVLVRNILNFSYLLGSVGTTILSRTIVLMLLLCIVTSHWPSGGNEGPHRIFWSSQDTLHSSCPSCFMTQTPDSFCKAGQKKLGLGCGNHSQSAITYEDDDLYIMMRVFYFFIGPECDHWQCLSLTHWLTNSLTAV